VIYAPSDVVNFGKGASGTVQSNGDFITVVMHANRDPAIFAPARIHAMRRRLPMRAAVARLEMAARSRPDAGGDRRPRAARDRAHAGAASGQNGSGNKGLTHHYGRPY